MYRFSLVPCQPSVVLWFGDAVCALLNLHVHWIINSKTELMQYAMVLLICWVALMPVNCSHDESNHLKL